MKKLTVLILVFVLVLASGAFLQGVMRSPDMLRHMGFGLHMAERNLFPCVILLQMKDEIGLTKEQVDKIEKIQGTIQENSIKRQADIKILELKLANSLQADKADRAQIEKSIRDISKLRTDMQIEHINHLLNIRDVLTPDQVKKIEELKKNFRSNRMENRRDWLGDRPGRCGRR
jgi:Spy/CpxP family protein refolding chaperone